MARLNNDGFTIAELLISIIVGAIFVSAVGVLLNSHIYLSKRSKDQTAVNLYANNKMEELRSKGFLRLADGTTELTNELPAGLSKPRSASMVISSETAAIKRVNVTVSYSDQGATRTYKYTALIGELGVGQY